MSKLQLFQLLLECTYAGNSSKLVVSKIALIETRFRVHHLEICISYLCCLTTKILGRLRSHTKRTRPQSKQQFLLEEGLDTL